MAKARSQSLLSERSDVKSYISNDAISQGGQDSPVAVESSQASINVKLLREVHRDGGIRKNVFEITQSNAFNNLILSLILINAVLVALESYDSIRRVYGWYFSLIDNIFLGIFVMECVVKMYSWRSGYFQSSWNIFDFSVVIMSIGTWIVPYVLVSFSVDVKIFRLFRLFRAVRAIRSLRALRAIRFFRSLQIILDIIHKSLPAISNILLLAGLFLFAFSAFGTVLFHEIDPRRFGTLFRSCFCVFQIMAQDEWINIYQENERKSSIIYLYVLLVTLVMHFVLLNLFIAVFVNNLESAKDKLREQRRVRKTHANENDHFDAFLDEVIDEKPDVVKSKESIDLPDGLFEEHHGIENFYPPNLPLRQKQLLAAYFKLLACLDSNQRSNEKQKKVIDKLVDLDRKSSYRK